MTELLPQPEQEYLVKLITILDNTLTNCLIAVYLFGSASYGAYEPIIPCPTRKLEFVVYTKEVVAAANPQFELNFNTSDGMTDYEATHWFLLDIASGREKGVALLGPPPDTVFAKPRHDTVVAAIVDCIEWHRQHESTGTWGSKAEGVEWAARNLEPEVPEVLRRVSLARRGRTSLSSGECDQFLELVLTRIRSGRS
ncbi:hypothetical protein ARMGADRAFT_1054854 [Armillaria gallica]|uniref:Uncharacterized protein n=1 Tax=Armillaria gallica TaxID=47427 RepID=A0A2H3DCU6_ARMGA|nr:hypothetical protein ARMGADRAFT_1054854 [Armillaria gallica]